MPSYDAFGRPVDGGAPLAAERARSLPPRAIAAVALVLLALAGVGIAMQVHTSHHVAPAHRATGAAPGTSPVLGGRSLLRAGNFAKALRTGRHRAGRGALIGIQAHPRSIDLQYAPVDGVARDVLVYPDGRTYLSHYTAKDYGHRFSLAKVDASAPQRFVPAAARAVHVPVDGLKSLGLLADQGSLIWFGTFAGYHGDVRGTGDGTVLAAHPYP
jgi:hypothetical protein